MPYSDNNYQADGSIPKVKDDLELESMTEFTIQADESLAKETPDDAVSDEFSAEFSVSYYVIG